MGLLAGAAPGIAAPSPPRSPAPRPAAAAARAAPAAPSLPGASVWRAPEDAPLPRPPLAASWGGRPGREGVSRRARAHGEGRQRGWAVAGRGVSPPSLAGSVAAPCARDEPGGGWFSSMVWTGQETGERQRDVESAWGCGGWTLQGSGRGIGSFPFQSFLAQARGGIWLAGQGAFSVSLTYLLLQQVPEGDAPGKR